MARYIFSGRILPERVAAGIVPPQKLSIEIPDANLSFEVTISVHASQVSVIVDAASGAIDIPTVRNYVEWSVRMLFDGYGYINSLGYDVEITSVVGPNGEHTVFGVDLNTPGESESGPPVEFAELWKLLTSGPESAALQRALADLREAVRKPHDTGFFCYRAVESLRQAFVEPQDGDNSKLSWERIRSALRIDRSWITLLEQFGKPQRHGETSYMSGDERIRALKRARRVVARYIEYTRGGCEPLPTADFDLLKES